MQNETIKIIKIRNTCFYLLKCHNGYLLVDAGWASKFKQFKKILFNLDIDIRSIKFILVTHHHHDHAALIHDIRKESNCKLIIHKEEIEYIKKGITYNKETRQYNTWLKILDKCFSPFIKGTYKPVMIEKEDIIVTDKDFNLITLTGINGKIIHTPGHSKGSISLLLNNGTAFIGDVAMNILKIFGQEYRPIEAENYNDICKSWSKLIAYGAKHIYPSHGNNFTIEDLKKNCITYNFK